MRKNISLLDKLVFSWKGNVFRRAITIADVDNDNDNELIVGSLEGSLTIFKGVEKSPWRVANNLGSITCIQVGDLLNNGNNLLVVISSEGICNIYLVEPLVSELTPILSQRLPPNASAMLIGDIDHDGKNELVIGTYDHSLYSFSLTLSNEKDKDNQNNNNNYSSFNINNNSNNNNSSQSNNGQNNNQEFPYTLNVKNKWQLPGQIGSLVMAKEKFGDDVLIVGLCEGTNYLILDKSGVMYKEGRDSLSTSDSFGTTPPTLTHLNNNLSPFGDPLRRKKTNEIITSISTPLTINPNSKLARLDKEEEDLNNEGDGDDQNRNNRCSNNKKSKNKASIVAVATLDGILKLQRVGKGTIWKMEVEDMGSGQLIALYSINMIQESTNYDINNTGNNYNNDNNSNNNSNDNNNNNNTGNNCIVACGWDGQTLIIDQDKNVVSFKFDDMVCAFTVGQYSLCRNTHTTCFVYVTFFGEIIVYYNIASNIHPTRSLKWCVSSQLDQLINTNNLIGVDRNELYQSLLSPTLLDINLMKKYLSKLKQQQQNQPPATNP